MKSFLVCGRQRETLRHRGESCALLIDADRMERTAIIQRGGHPDLPGKNHRDDTLAGVGVVHLMFWVADQ